jgi:hypothetical protein
MTQGLKPRSFLLAYAWAPHGTSDGLLTPKTKDRKSISAPLPPSSAANSIEPARGPGKLETQDHSSSAQFALSITRIPFEVRDVEAIQLSGTSLSEQVSDDFKAHPCRKKQ